MKQKFTKKQLAVIDSLFAGDGEEAILEKHKLTKSLYNKWLADDNFKAGLNDKIEAAHRQGKILIARYVTVAAAKLVALTESENQETARKACLDIINSEKKNQPTNEKLPDEKPADNLPQLSPKTAGKLLAVLAEQ